MPRPKRNRKIQAAPRAIAFFPVQNSKSILEFDIELYLEEYESVRLRDYEGMSHLEAAKLMQISRPTYTRIYDSARKKIARALVENKSIKIAGGQVVFEDDWYRCSECDSVFTGEDHHCKSVDNEYINDSLNRGYLKTGKQLQICSCDKCGKEYPKEQGVPCRYVPCKFCGQYLVRITKNMK